MRIFRQTLGLDFGRLHFSTSHCLLLIVRSGFGSRAQARRSRLIMSLRQLCKRSFSSVASTVGLVGYGKMGAAMAANFMNQGLQVSVFDTNEESMAHAKAAGASLVQSPGELASSVNTIVSIVPNDAALKSISLGPDGIIENLTKSKLHISCSTVSPHTSREIGSLHAEAGLGFVGAPVFARPDGLAEKAAYFVLGGPHEAAEEAKSLLQYTSKQCFVFGDDYGAGNVVKLCGNFLIASTIESLGEALALAESNGLDRTQVMEMLTSTIFDCLIYKGYGGRVASRDHRPGGFSLELGSKDVTLVADTAHRSKVPMPFASVLHDRFLAAEARGRGDIDWSAIGLSISEDAGEQAAVDAAIKFARATQAKEE